MQIGQAIRRFGAHMSAGFAALMNRSGAEPGRFRLRIDKALLRRGVIVLGGVALLYYPVGAMWSHNIDVNPDFDVDPGARLKGDSLAVALGVGLLDREVNQHVWVANSPFYLPTALLHNMASYQTAIVEVIARFAGALGGTLESRGMRSDDLTATVDRLSKRPDVWSWDWSEPWGYLGNSEGEYREGLLDLQGYNVALADNAAGFPKDAPLLALILSRFSAELQEAAAALDNEAGYRPVILSRRLGDAFYHARGVAYAQMVLLRGLKSDFGALIAARGLAAAMTEAELALRRVALFSPVFVINGRPDNVVLPSHPLIETYYMLDAERALQGLIAQLG